MASYRTWATVRGDCTWALANARLRTSPRQDSCGAEPSPAPGINLSGQDLQGASQRGFAASAETSEVLHALLKPGTLSQAGER